MGVWVEFVMACELKKDIPQQVIDVLTCIDDPSRIELCKDLDIPLHPFFQEEDWPTIFLTDCAYFPGDINYTFRYDDDSKAYHLTLHFKVKGNFYVNGFLHWLSPYSDTQGFVGYTRTNETPEISLILFEKDKAYLAEVTSTERVEISERML